MKELKPISKEELIGRLKEIALLGWIENDIRKTNDGAAGNKFEDRASPKTICRYQTPQSGS